MKPIFIGLKDEKIALTKEVTELKEQLRVLEQEHNKKLLKIEKNHELSSKAQEQKLSAAKEATMKEIAAKNESEISVRSLQEMLSSAKQEMITFAQNATHDKDLLISKMNNNLQAAEEAEKKQAKVKVNCHLITSVEDQVRIPCFKKFYPLIT